MDSFTKGFGHDISSLIHASEYWSPLNTAGATIVDVGGANGHVSMALARAYPNLHFIVQDLEHNIVKARAEIPEDLKGRVDLQVHDFFKV